MSTRDVRQDGVEGMAGQSSLFLALGWAVFVLGWIGVIYLMVDTGNGDHSFGIGGGGAQGKVFLALEFGTLVTIAAGILWGVASAISTRAAIVREIARAGERRPA